MHLGYGDPASLPAPEFGEAATCTESCSRRPRKYTSSSGGPMVSSEPAISFRELFAYTDYLANRWFAYFSEHETALAINIGGQTGTLRSLVEHIVRVEQFFANRLI